MGGGGGTGGRLLGRGGGLSGGNRSEGGQEESGASVQSHRRTSLGRIRDSMVDCGQNACQGWLLDGAWADVRAGKTANPVLVFRADVTAIGQIPVSIRVCKSRSMHL